MEFTKINKTFKKKIHEFSEVPWTLENFSEVLKNILKFSESSWIWLELPRVYLNFVESSEFFWTCWIFPEVLRNLHEFSEFSSFFRKFLEFSEMCRNFSEISFSSQVSWSSQNVFVDLRKLLQFLKPSRTSQKCPQVLAKLLKFSKFSWSFQKFLRLRNILQLSKIYWTEIKLSSKKFSWISQEFPEIFRIFLYRSDFT